MTDTISRHEWVQRFTSRIHSYFPVTDVSRDEGFSITPAIISAELESWPLDDPTGLSDWRETTPEDAADDNLEAWMYG